MEASTSNCGLTIFDTVVPRFCRVNLNTEMFTDTLSTVSMQLFFWGSKYSSLLNHSSAGDPFILLISLLYQPVVQ